MERECVFFNLDGDIILMYPGVNLGPGDYIVLHETGYTVVKKGFRADTGTYEYWLKQENSLKEAYEVEKGKKDDL